MPRGGPPTNTYSLPAVYLAVPGTTILAVQHNSPLEDIADVLNDPWPTNIGGTGGTSIITSWDSLNSRGVDIPTASTVDLDASTGANLHFTGTTTVTAISLSNGRVREVISDGAFTLTAGASLVVNGSTSVNGTITAGMMILFVGGSAGVVYAMTSGGGGSGSLFSYTTTATAAGTTTLTVASTYQQFFTGATTQTVVLPVTSTLTLGTAFRIVNNSTGALTVNSSGGNLVVTIPGGFWCLVTCVLTSGTTAASWSAILPVGQATQTAPGLIEIATPTEAATLTDSTRAVAPDGLFFLGGYTTTATAAGTTTLTVISTYYQYFTGTTTQTLVLPVTSTLVLGRTFRVANNSTGAVTVQSSGANNIAVLAAGAVGFFTCILTSGTSAASWSFNGVSASYEFVTSIAASTSSTINFDTSTSVTIAANYDYIIRAEFVKMSADGGLALRFGTGGTPTYQTTNYTSIYMTANAGTVGAATDSITNAILLTHILTGGASAGEQLSIECKVDEPAANDTHLVSSIYSGVASDGTIQISQTGGKRTTAEVLTGLQIVPIAGNISTGLFSLFRRRIR